MRVKRSAILLWMIPLTGCSIAQGVTQPTPATLGYVTAVHNDLITLPAPKGKITAAVYKFRDQTGQYKDSDRISSFSTAVTQGATSVLIKALEDSNWFIPLEREGLPNLLNERKIIQSIRSDIEKSSTELPLPPLANLKYASIIFEGGIISYDTNLITGGFGARYLGTGPSEKFRRDSVTIYLRALSVQDGTIIKSVTTNKTVLSQEVSFGVYRFLRLGRILEVETGLTTNEPHQLCVLESIEKAVYSLILEGAIAGAWNFKDDSALPVIQKYLSEKQTVSVNDEAMASETNSSPVSEEVEQR